MARPKKYNIDTDKVEQLASFGCSNTEIASFFGCSKDLITKSYYYSKSMLIQNMLLKVCRITIVDT